MDLVDRYFWFVAGLVGILNVAIWRSRLRPIVALGRVTQAEADAFVRGAALWIAIATGALGAISLAFSVSPRCTQPFSNLTEPASVATTTVFLLAWGGLLRWVWGPGGEFLARAPGAFMTPASPDTEYEPSTVRIVVTGVVLSSAVGAAVVSSGMPAVPGC